MANKKGALQVLLVIVGLFFVAGIYPLLMSIRVLNKEDFGDQMMLAVYFVLGIFLLLAVKSPAQHRSLIAFTGWGSLAHDAVMGVQNYQLGQLRSNLPVFVIFAAFCIALMVLLPPRQEIDR